MRKDAQESSGAISHVFAFFRAENIFGMPVHFVVNDDNSIKQNVCPKNAGALTKTRIEGTIQGL